MKKTLVLPLLALAALCAQPAHAQLRFGVRGGMNISKLKYDGGALTNPANRTGWFIGPTAEFKIPMVGLGVNAGLLFDQRRTNLYQMDGESYSKTEQYIDIPINFKYSFGLSSLASLYLQAGPQFDWRIGKKNYYFDTNSGYRSETWTKSFNVGFGSRLGGHFDIGANYNFTFNKTGRFYDDDGTYIKSKRNTWQVYVGYVF